MSESSRIDELKRRVQSDPASIAFAALAEEYRRAGRFDEAIETCTTGLVRHPSYLSAHVTLGRALIEVGRFEEAREELEQVLKLAPENLAAIRGLAEIHSRLRDAAHDYRSTEDSAYTEPEAAEPAGTRDLAELPIQEPIVAEPNFAEPNFAEPNLAEPNLAELNLAEPNLSEPNLSEPNLAELNLAELNLAELNLPELNLAEPQEPAEPPEPQVPGPPSTALIGLERFLVAIQRARAERGAHR